MEQQEATMNKLADRIQDNMSKLKIFSLFIDNGECGDDLTMSLGARAGIGKILYEISNDLCDIED